MELLEELNGASCDVTESRRSSDVSHGKIKRLSARGRGEEGGEGGGSEEDSVDMIEGVACDDSDNLCVEKGGAVGTDVEDEDCWSKDLDSTDGKEDEGGGVGGGSCDVRCVIASLLVMLLVSGAVALVVMLQGFTGDAVYEIKFAWYYDDGMVLQRSPARSVLWGTSSLIDRINTTVVVEVERVASIGSSYQAYTSDQPAHRRYVTNVSPNAYGNVWRVSLEPITDPGPYNITVYFAAFPQFSATIGQVYFGDVWVCANQNRLQLDLQQLLNTSTEYIGDRERLMKRLEKVHLFSLTSAKSDMISYELRGIDLPWTRFSEKLIEDRYQVPEICVQFILELSRSVTHPLALVTVSYADSRIEEWMPPSALDSCHLHYTDSSSRVWNGMINPMLHVQLKGVIFIPGELDSLNTYSRYKLYNCSLVELFVNWRNSSASEVMKGLKSQIPPADDVEYSSIQHFFIAIVQAPPRLSVDSSHTSHGAAELRWAQTANYGYLPNPVLKRSLIVPTIDLPPFTLPPPTIPPHLLNNTEALPARSNHPRFQNRYEDISVRLYHSIHSTVYTENTATLPRPTAYAIRSSSFSLHFESNRFHLMDSKGFEICCTRNLSVTCDTFSQHIQSLTAQSLTADDGRDWAWLEAPVSSPRHSSRPITSSTPTHDTLTLSTSSCSYHVVAVRYAWRDAPCRYLGCALYSTVARHSPPQTRYMPMPPFLYSGALIFDGQKRTFSTEPIKLSVSEISAV